MRIKNLYLALILLTATFSFACYLHAEDVLPRQELTEQELPKQETVSVKNEAALVETNEANIPVLTSVKNAKSVSGVSNFRVIMGFVVIFAMSGGLIYFSRWYAKRNRKSQDPSRIKIVSQQFVGPHKSLAIVRVAGESVLIGITDHNITMLKSLAMLEDEEAETGISSFKNTLMSNQAQTDEEDFATQSVTDKITTRMKGMRTL